MRRPPRRRATLAAALLAAFALLSAGVALAATPSEPPAEKPTENAAATPSCHGAPAAGPAQGHPAADPHAGHRAMAAAPQIAERPESQAVDSLSIPDVAVVDQDGRERRFYSDLVAGKTVAINFVFTTCTTICPPMGANFARLRRDLGERAGRDVHLISVSVDPVTDTPERLHAWREKFGAGDGWTLVTGERPEITRLLKALEVFTPDFTEHSPVALLGHEPSGTWTRAYGLAPPAQLAQILDDTAAPAVAAASADGHEHAGQEHAGHEHAGHEHAETEDAP